MTRCHTRCPLCGGSYEYETAWYGPYLRCEEGTCESGCDPEEIVEHPDFDVGSPVEREWEPEWER